MRWAIGILMLGALFVLPSATASPTPYELTDSSGDVTKADRPFSGPVADANDILKGVVRETADRVVFELTLRNLSGMPADPLDQEFHAQYAFSFTTDANLKGYSMRATYQNLARSPNPLGPWTFSVHDRTNDTWPSASGEVDGNTLRWRIPLSAHGLVASRVLSEWEIAAWFSYGGGEQSNDRADGTGSYVIGKGSFAGASGKPASEPVVGTFSFTDEKGDVSSGGDATQARQGWNVDVLEVRIGNDSGDLIFELDLRDLSVASEQLSDPGFHAQYALSFTVEDRGSNFSARATFGGERYTHDANGAWRFSLHIHETDEWPDAEGWIRNSTIIWRVPPATIDAQAGSVLAGWNVNTWNSYESRDQFNDYGRSDGSVQVGEAGPGSASLRPGNSSDQPNPSDEVSIPGMQVVFAVAGMGVACFRRRHH